MASSSSSTSSSYSSSTSSSTLDGTAKAVAGAVVTAAVAGAALNHSSSSSEAGSIKSKGKVAAAVGAIAGAVAEVVTRGKKSKSSSSSSSSSAHKTHVVVNTIYADRSSSEELGANRRRVVRRVERQAPRLVHHEEHIVDDGRVLKEYEFEEQVAVEYRAIREDVVEHLVAVPVTEEEVKRDKMPVRIVEVEKIIPVQKIVEVPEVEIVEKIKEVPTPSGRVNKKINYVPRKKIVPQERKVFVERPVEEIVEVPAITYVDVEEVVETIEVPEYQDVIKIKEVKVPTVIEVPREVIKERDQVTDVEVLIPVGVEAHTKVQYTVPTIVEKRNARGYPVYVPRFVEVPTNSIQMTGNQRHVSKKLMSQMKELEHSMDGKIISVCEVEKMGVAARDHYSCIQGHIDATDLKTSLLNVFGNDKLSRSSSIGEKPVTSKDKHEGYYGSSNVTGQWNNIAYTVPAPKKTHVVSHAAATAGHSVSAVNPVHLESHHIGGHHVVSGSHSATHSMKTKHVGHVTVQH